MTHGDTLCTFVAANHAHKPCLKNMPTNQAPPVSQVSAGRVGPEEVRLGAARRNRALWGEWGRGATVNGEA